MSPNPKPDDPNDWWKDLWVYLSKEQADLWTRSLNYLLKLRKNPQILSAIIHSLGILALVLHRLSKKVAEATEHLARGVDQCGMQNELLRENTAATNQLKHRLEQIHIALSDMSWKIQHATVPWVKIAGVAVLSGCIVAIILVNVDHFQFLRVPDSQDQVIRNLRADHQKDEDALIQLQDKCNRLQLQLDRGDTEADNVIKLQYDRGYKQALDDIQRRQHGQ